MKERNATIDIAKAIAIWMVVTAHLIRKGPVTDYLAATAVAMFFFLSGMTYHYHDDQKVYWRNVVIRIGFPYLTVGLVSICIYRLLGTYAAASIGALVKYTSFWEDLFHLLYGSSLHGAMKWNESLWFLPCYLCVLIITNLIERLMSKREQKSTVYVVTAIMFGLLGIFLTKQAEQYLQIGLPWHLETACLIYPIFAIGRISKKIFVKKEESTKRFHQSMPVMMAILFGGIHLCISRWFVPLSIRTNELSLWPLTYVYLMLGICFVWSVSQVIAMLRIEWMLKALLLVGKSTLSILVWNKFPVLVMQLLAKRWNETLPVAYIETQNITGILIASLLAILCIGLCLFWSWILRKMEKNITARRKCD